MSISNIINNISEPDFQTLLRSLNGFLCGHAFAYKNFADFPVEMMFGVISTENSVSLVNSQDQSNGLSSIDFLYQQKIDDFILISRYGDSLKVFWNHLEEDGEIELSPEGNIKTIFYKNREKMKLLFPSNETEIANGYKAIMKSLDTKKDVA